MHKPTVALAFSGGLDTSYCVPRLADQGYADHTVYVNTGGPGPEELAAVRRQAEAVGTEGHHEVDARAGVFDRFVRFLIQGNVLRGEVYPSASRPSGPSRRSRCSRWPVRSARPRWHTGPRRRALPPSTSTIPMLWLSLRAIPRVSSSGVPVS